MKPITELNEAELEEVFARSSGPGGQNVNKVSTRVLLRHLPTGVFVAVQDSRSQAKNRELARIRLLEALNERMRKADEAARNFKESERRRTRPRPPRVKRQILASKKHRATIKKERSRKDFD